MPATALAASLAIAGCRVDPPRATGARWPDWLAAAGALAAIGFRVRRGAGGPARRRAGGGPPGPPPSDGPPSDGPPSDGRRQAALGGALGHGDPRYREIVDAAPVGLLGVDRDGRITLANPQAARLFGWPAEALVGLGVDALVPEGLRDAHAAHRDAYRRAPRRRRIGEGGDVFGLRRDGTTVPIEIGLSPLGPPGDGTVLASVVDLSARHAQQRQLQSMLREKTVLLDEVHHRVKNNLQVITSLLSLQARTAPPEAREALAECRNRVHAMALTHQLLHENADVARLHLGEYLSRLGRLLADAHRAAAPGVSLHVEGADTPLHLALPRAIPCGLLVNELVTHAYRHAFAPDRAGGIVVGLAIDGADARLWVAADDAPPPAGTPPDAARSLAWQLVPLLVEQLGGRLSRGAGPGTRIEVRFPVEDGTRP